MSLPQPLHFFRVQLQEPSSDLASATDVGFFQEFFPLLLTICVLVASGGCLYYAHRMFRILYASPTRPKSFGFDLYQGSALAEVHQLKSGVVQLNTTLASKMNTLASRFQQVSEAVDEIRERMGAFDVVTARLQKENDVFRDGFLASHQDHLLGRLLCIRDQVSRIEPEKRLKYIEGEIDALLDFVLVKSIPDTALLGQVLDDSTVRLCEVVQVKPTSNISENGVISEVLSSAFVIQVGPKDERVVKRAKVEAFRLAKSPMAQPEQMEAQNEDAALCQAASNPECAPSDNKEAGE